MDKPKTIEWGQEPEDGMILVGFSAEALLEGKDLKKKILTLVKQKDLGFRKAVKCLMDEGLASFDESIEIIKQIKNDARSKKESYVMNTPYKYSINRMFWAFEKDVPKKDPRYFKLNLIDCKNIKNEEYQNQDKSFNAKKFIMDNISEEEKERIKKSKGKMESSIVDSEESANYDNEWDVSKK